MIRRFTAAALVMTVALSGCDKMKDALSAHSNTAAKANDEELTVTQLANMIGASQAPLRKEVISAVVDAWVDYHLVGQSAANNDSLNDVKLADEAMWSAIANIKASKWYSIVSKSWAAPDSTQAEAFYNEGKVLAASHILWLTQGKSEADKPAIKKKAEAVRAQLTSANFAAMAQKNSEDPGSKVKGGSLGIFPRGAMVAQFEQALLATKPGEISPVFETPYGYHIIRRPTFAEVRADVIEASKRVGMQAQESTYLTTLEKTHDFKMKPGTEATIRATVEDPMLHQSDKTVIATTDLGDFTAAKLAKWVVTIPAQARISQQIKQAPDSVLPGFVRNFIRNELVIHSADSAKIAPDAQQLAEIRKYLPNTIVQLWTALKVDPKTLGSSKGDRVKTANQKIDQYMSDLLGMKAQFVDVTQPVQFAMRKKYGFDINADAVARALVEAANVRLRTDSTKTSQQPPTAVPLPNRDTTKR
jgi:hypothetical protein